MKKRIVVKVCMNDDKSRSKALKISAGILGVESAALWGSNKDQVVVVGDIDAVALTRQLRKHVGQTELLSVGGAESSESVEVWSYAPPPYNGYNSYPICEVRENHEHSCTIM